MKTIKILLSFGIASTLASCVRDGSVSTDDAKASVADELKPEAVVEQPAARPDTSLLGLAHDIFGKDSPTVPLTDRERFEQRLELAQALLPMKVRDDVSITKAALDGDYLNVQIAITDSRINPEAVTAELLAQKIEPLRQSNSMLSETLDLMRSAGISVKLDITSITRGTSSTLTIPCSEM